MNEEKYSNTQRQEIEEVAGRDKMGEGAIRKMRKQGEIATKPKLVEVKDSQEREGQRRMTKERNIKTENTLSALQEEVTEPLREEEQSHQIVKNR